MGRKGKKIGHSIIGRKSGGLKLRPPTPEEIDEIKKELEAEKRAGEKDKELEESGETKLPKLPMPSGTIEPKHNQKLPTSLADVDKAMKREGIEVKEVPDKRLKKKKKTRIDIKEIQQ